MGNLESGRKTRAISFSDIKGYSRLMGENEPLALRLLEEHNAICVPLIEKHGGTVLKFIGDAILSSFESASDAVQCGVALQRVLAERNSSRPDVVPLIIRIGIHIGDVVFKDGDVFGDGVNIAARIEPLAEPGGVAISQTVYDMIKARPEIQTVSLGAKDLKNIKDAINIYKVLIQAHEDAPERSVPKPVMIGVGLAAAAALCFVGVQYAARLGPRRAAAPSGAAANAEPPEAAAPAKSGLAQDERRNLSDVRDDAWGNLKPILSSNQITADEKARQAMSFYQRFHEMPGIHLARAAELARYMPPGPEREELVRLAKSPAAIEAVIRVRIKTAASEKAADAMAFSDHRRREDFIGSNPMTRAGDFVDVSAGAPLKDPDGNVIFKYKTAAGQVRNVAMSPAIFFGGPAAEAAIAKAASDLSTDFLRSSQGR